MKWRLKRERMTEIQIGKRIFEVENADSECAQAEIRKFQNLHESVESGHASKLCYEDTESISIRCSSCGQRVGEHQDICPSCKKELEKRLWNAAEYEAYRSFLYSDEFPNKIRLVVRIKKKHFMPFHLRFRFE